MSDALEKLKSLGSQKIHEDTYIPKEYIQAILDENYEKLTRVQYFGFLSILERDYNIDLEEIKAHALEYYNEEMATEMLANSTVFVTPLKEKNFNIFYIFVALFIFLVALYYTFSVTDKENKSINTDVQIETPINQTVEKDVISKVNETPVTPKVENFKVERNLTKQTEPKVVKVAEKSKSLEILPRSRVWLGYINVATNKKYQKTFSDELDLNASKEWIFISGHGYIDVIINGQKTHFSNKNSLRLHYKDGVLEKISTDEFRKLNRGRKW